MQIENGENRVSFNSIVKYKYALNGINIQNRGCYKGQ